MWPFKSKQPPKPAFKRLLDKLTEQPAKEVYVSWEFFGDLIEEAILRIVKINEPAFREREEAQIRHSMTTGELLVPSPFGLIVVKVHKNKIPKKVMLESIDLSEEL